MSMFEELLKETIRSLSDAYKLAENDLVEQTQLASEAVERVTRGIAKLALEKTSETTESTRFTLYVAGGDKLSEVTNFVIPMKGYPIKVASDATSARLRNYEAVLKTKDDLLTYFAQLASNGDSRLALRIAFLLRKAKVDQEEIETGEQEE